MITRSRVMYSPLCGALGGVVQAHEGIRPATLARWVIVSRKQSAAGVGAVGALLCALEFWMRGG